MRRTINREQEPMSLQEVRRREEEAEQRIHAADGLLATAEARLEEVKTITEATRLEYIKLENGRAIAEESLNKWEALSRQAEKDKRELEAQVAKLKDEHVTLVGVQLDELQKIREARVIETENLKSELVALVARKDKVRVEFDDICRVVEERKHKAQSLSETARRLEEKREQIEAEVASLEPKQDELAELNATILARKDAIVGISEEYAAKVEAVAAEEAKISLTKAATEAETRRVQELHEALAVREAEVDQKIASSQAIQENLETMRTRMQRAEKDAEAKKFLERGY